jgi:hypothetical protein
MIIFILFLVYLETDRIGYEDSTFMEEQRQRIFIRRGEDIIPKDIILFKEHKILSYNLNLDNFFY